MWLQSDEIILHPGNLKMYGISVTGLSSEQISPLQENKKIRLSGSENNAKYRMSMLSEKDQYYWASLTLTNATNTTRLRKNTKQNFRSENNIRDTSNQFV